MMNYAMKKLESPSTTNLPSTYRLRYFKILLKRDLARWVFTVKSVANVKFST